ncbi:MAG: 2'-5' RNA ligase family protein [Jatrophihabitans sp.]|uniref:2'-5' RNA ligase family protein n=1 Tax=Jatrophihabitans sp. TaxID=1932789 RepID=UPI003F806FE4
MQPLVITLALDDAAQDRFDAERRALFPPGRTAVGAHVTLFHAVPGEREPDVRADLAEVAGPSFDVLVARVQSLGRGAAYVLDSDELVRRHRELQRRWAPHLTAQDSQGFRPHITVQNKVTPAEARATVARLQAGFQPFAVRAEGWSLWRYDGGPWTHLATIPFA